MERSVSVEEGEMQWISDFDHALEPRQALCKLPDEQQRARIGSILQLGDCHEIAKADLPELSFMLARSRNLERVTDECRSERHVDGQACRAQYSGEHAQDQAEQHRFSVAE